MIVLFTSPNFYSTPEKKSKPFSRKCTQRIGPIDIAGFSITGPFSGEKKFIVVLSGSDPKLFRLCYVVDVFFDPRKTYTFLLQA